MAKSRAKAPPWRDRVVSLERVRAGDLAGNPANWRRHPQAQVEALKGVLSEVGFAGALLAYQEDGRLTLIDGHLRAGLDSEAEVPVLVLDVDRAEARKLLATFDPLGAMAQPDMDAMLSLLESVETGNQAIKDMLDALANGSYQALVPMPDMEPKGLTDPDDVPEVAAESWVRRGDIFQLGEHRIMCGDSTKVEDVTILMWGAKAVLMATDPPYGDSWIQKAKDMQAHGYGHSRAGLHGSIASDDKPEADLKLLLDSFLSAAKIAGSPPFPVYVWHGARRILFEQALLDAGYLVHQPIVWVKPSFVIGRLHYHPQCEWALHGWLLGGGKCPFYGLRNQADVWQIGRENDGLHPTQKPVELFAIPLRNHTKLGEIAYDPFLGSGTSLIACEKLSRICYGMEIEPQYVQVALERWQNYTGRKAVKVANGNSGSD